MPNTPLHSSLPRLIDPRKFAQQGLSLNGHVAISELSRLLDISQSSDGEVDVALDFDVDEQRHRMITGTVKCVLKVACQRCLEAVDVPLSAELNLAIVWNEDKAKQLPRSLEPLILDEGPADIYTIIEDELLLNLPLASYHKDNCIEHTSFGDAEVEEDIKPAKNPFQMLEQLKGSPKS